MYSYSQQQGAPGEKPKGPLEALRPKLQVINLSLFPSMLTDIMSIPFHHNNLFFRVCIWIDAWYNFFNAFFQRKCNCSLITACICTHRLWIDLHVMFIICFLICLCYINLCLAYAAPASALKAVYLYVFWYWWYLWWLSFPFLYHLLL